MEGTCFKSEIGLLRSPPPPLSSLLYSANLYPCHCGLCNMFHTHTHTTYVWRAHVSNQRSDYYAVLLLPSLLSYTLLTSTHVIVDCVICSTHTHTPHTYGGHMFQIRDRTITQSSSSPLFSPILC